MRLEVNTNRKEARFEIGTAWLSNKGGKAWFLYDMANDDQGNVIEIWQDVPNVYCGAFGG